MTREEEERRLALSTAIAQINAAHDALDAIDWPVLSIEMIRSGAVMRGAMREIVKFAQADLDALKKKAIDEEREAAK